MELLNKIKEDFMSAYKAKDMERKNYLGFLKSEVTKETKTPDDAYIIGKFKAMVKNSVETSSLNELELAVLNSYIPKQMSEEDLSVLIGEWIGAKKLSGTQDMGKVMTYLKTNYAGEYDGRMASTLAKELLQLVQN